MDDAVTVGESHRAGQQPRQLGRFRRRLRLAGDLLGQTAAVHVLQRQEGKSLLLADGVDLDDVGVLQTGLGAGLGTKALALLGAGVDAGHDDLEGHQSIQGDLVGLVDDPHAAVTENVKDLVAGDGQAQRRQRLPDGDPGAEGDRPALGGIGLVPRLGARGRGR